MLNTLDRHPRAALLIVLGIGLAVRLYMLPTAGFALDLVQHYEWGQCALDNGLFGMYVCPSTITHPPVNPVFYGVMTWLFGLLGADLSYFEGNALVSIALKLHLILFELALVGLVYEIVRRKVGARWALLAATLLYWNPGWLTVTAWWGQNDASYSLFMLIAACLLARRVRWAWAAYSLAWLAKFQSIMFLPLFGLLSLRRHGPRATLEGGLIFAAILVGGVLPFYLGSGQAALYPFGGTVGLFPYITNGAYNLWYWVSGSSQTVLLDSLPFAFGLTYSQAAWIALALGTALLCARAWWIEEEDDVYLLMFAANLIFFMLPSQIQVRYLYPGVMFLAVVVGLRRDWRWIAFYAALSLAFTYNVFDQVWLGIGLLYYPYRLMFWNETHTALAMTALFVIFMGWFLRPLAGRLRPQRTASN